MATLQDVERLVAELPGTEEKTRHGTRTWTVGGKAYAWERPFSKADLKRFGDETPPDESILAIRVEDLGEKEAVLTARAGDGFFTIPHFDNYAAVLIELELVPEAVLREALLDGWLVFAPAAQAQDVIAARRRRAKD
ncbi:MmcQ/YjbR family DNA-binding protein [Kribbella yunnanensis]|uniref:MmcQ/YjbR family DNA-binding protein n=1 Tax=Kribbella yunnanensis TaxID=190194 RepID=A0ABP4V910_9ACTN